MPNPDDTKKPGTMYSVTFQPGNVVVAGVPAGETLLRAAARAEVFLPSPCAGAGSCGRCLVQIEGGKVKAERTASIDPDDWERGMRLACVTRVIDDVVVRVREGVGSGVAHPSGAATLTAGLRGRLLEAADTPLPERMREFDPPVRVVLVALMPPSAEDRVSDLARLRSALGEQLGTAEVSASTAVVQTLPQVLRTAEWKVAAVVRAVKGGWEVIRVRAGDDSAPSYLAVVDVGTTTVWGQLLDGPSGQVLATAAAFNQQIRYGDDVISRMVRAREPGGKERLQTAVVDTITEVLGDLVTRADVTQGSIDYVVVAGNTSMTCFLLGVETHHLRLEPYVPPFDSLAPVPASVLGLRAPLAPEAVVQTLPVVGSYVGGDIVAGILASGIAEGDDVCLYLDIGTNGEVVIGNREWLLATSCSAGPAFEGGGLRHGMRAVAGAVESVTIDRQTMEAGVLTIDDALPLGICGSGVIDAVAELLKAGILLPSGRFDPGSGAPGLREYEGRWEFVLVPGEFSATGADIVLTEADIDNVVRAKAAMFAGVTTLLRAVSLEWEDLDRIVVAGAFGRHLRPAQAMTIGLFPELDLGRFEFLGNGSLLGGRAVARSRTMGERAVEVASLMNNIELSDNPLFQEEYVAAMFLPHTDAGRFPSMERLLSSLGSGDR
jgi:uncharacterized 2Fe-2S/4Fe-4S cluster protein (DUF4445 family)